MRARHTHRLKNGGECVRALGQLGEAVLHEAVSNDQTERNGSPASYYKSTRQLQRKITRYLHTRYLKISKSYIRIRARLFQASPNVHIAAPSSTTFLTRNRWGERESAGKSPRLCLAAWGRVIAW